MNVLDIIKSLFLGGNNTFPYKAVILYRNGIPCEAISILRCEASLIIKTNSREIPYIPLNDCTEDELTLISNSL